MRKPTTVACAKCPVVEPRLGKAEIFVWATPYLGCALVILTIILPKTYLADFVVGSHPERTVAAAGTEDAAYGTHSYAT